MTLTSEAAGPRGQICEVSQVIGSGGQHAELKQDITVVMQPRVSATSTARTLLEPANLMESQQNLVMTIDDKHP